MSEEKLIDNAGLISDKLIQYMDAAEKVITQYGGDAVNLGLNVLRIEAASMLVAPLVFFIFGIVGFYYSLTMLFPYLKKTIDDGLGEYLFTICVASISGTIALVNLYELLNIWAWIGIFWPEAYAVHTFMM